VLDKDICEVSKLGPAGVSYDELGSLLEGLLDLQSYDRVILGGVGPYDEYRLGVLLQLIDGVGHCATAERCPQTGDGDGVS